MIFGVEFDVDEIIAFEWNFSWWISSIIDDDSFWFVDVVDVDKTSLWYLSLFIFIWLSSSSLRSLISSIEWFLYLYDCRNSFVKVPGDDFKSFIWWWFKSSCSISFVSSNVRKVFNWFDARTPISFDGETVRENKENQMQN